MGTLNKIVVNCTYENVFNKGSSHSPLVTPVRKEFLLVSKEKADNPAAWKEQAFHKEGGRESTAGTRDPTPYTPTQWRWGWGVPASRVRAGGLVWGEPPFPRCASADSTHKMGVRGNRGAVQLLQ